MYSEIENEVQTFGSKEKIKEKAEAIIKLLDKCFEELPSEVYGLEIPYSTRIATIYALILQNFGEEMESVDIKRISDRVAKLTDDNVRSCKEQIAWMQTLDKSERGLMDYYKYYLEKNTSLKLLNVKQ